MLFQLIRQIRKLLRSCLFAYSIIGLILLLCISASSNIAFSRSGFPGPNLQHNPAHKMKHIVFILKENHSFDNYFGLFPGVNGASTGLVKVNGIQKSIPLGPFQDIPFNYSHFWENAHIAYDSGAMDQFNQGVCASSPYPCYQVAKKSDIPNYWKLAKNFLLSDNTFSSLTGPSFPNHMYSVSGASGPDIDHSAVNNPTSPNSWGCDSPAGTTVQLYNGTYIYPCFQYQTLADVMNATGVSWKYYAPQSGEDGYVWNTLDAYKQDRSTSNDVPWQNFVTDAQNNALPAFSWLVAPTPYSEHPGINSNQISMCAGENWTVQQINAVEQSPEWSSTVIVLAWDDYGGYYDHVAPHQVDALGYGFRVPLLMISPYAHATDNPGNPHVSHDSFEFASVLRLAEEAFNMPSLGKRDVTAGDLLKTLDFSRVWNQPIILKQRVCP